MSEKKKAEKRKAESGTENVTERNQFVLNNAGGAIVMDGNTAEERLQISHPSGANINLNNKTFSMFAPNNAQELTLGDKFSTTAGNSHIQTRGGSETRAYGDITLVAGAEAFFNEPVADEWIDLNQDIAAAKAGPELAYGGVGNNTDVEFQVDGTPSSDGTVEGGTYNTNAAQDNVQQLMEEKAGDIAKVESKMGEGGSIKMMSVKHLHLQAGAKPVSFDSGLIVKDGRSVTRKTVIEDGALTEIKTGTTLFESKDTSSAVPFGDIHLAAGTKIRGTAGSGGIGLKTSGQMDLNTTGRMTIGGAEVAIGGSTSNSAGTIKLIGDVDVFISSSDLVTVDSANVNINATDQVTVAAPITVYTGDLHVYGDLIVEGEIVAMKDITAGGRGGVSLLKHTHGGVCRGGSKTAKPN